MVGPVVDYVTLAEAATYLGVSKATLRNWDKGGKIKAARHPVNDYRMYALTDLRDMKSQLSLFADSETPHDDSQPIEILTVRDVKKIIGRLHNAMRDTDANSSLISRFDELSKLLFLAIYASENAAVRHAIGLVHLKRADYAAKIKAAYSDLCLDLPIHVPPHFANIHCSDDAILECGRILSFINFKDAPFDVKGLAYEEMIKRTFDKTDNQQFFTPNHIVAFMIQFYQDHVGGDICDPASGTGGFLVEVAKTSRPYTSLTALEIDERLAWVSGLNMYLHGGKNISSITLQGGGTLGQNAERHYSSYDIIFTNPPFGSDYTDQNDLSQYILGKEKSSRRRGILFIERCYQLLRPNGRMGIIIDEGVLNLPHAEDVRSYIIEHFNIDAIVSLPESAFMPYASVNASILFLHKRKAPHTGNVFFGRAEKVGRKLNGDDDLIYGLDGAVTVNSDLPDILGAWNRKSQSTDGIGELGYWANLRRNFAEDPDSFRLDFRFHDPSRDESIRRLEASQYGLVPLSDLCDERNMPVIPAKELSDSVILYTGLAHIESQTGIAHQEPTAANSVKSAVKQYEPGDIVFARMRPNLRKVALMDFAEGGYVSPECVVLIPRKDEKDHWLIEPIVLSVVLRSDLVFGQITHLIAGIGRPRLNVTNLRKVRIPVPPGDIQREIRTAYEKALQSANTLRSQAARLQQDAVRGEHIAVSSLAAKLAGLGPES